MSVNAAADPIAAKGAREAGEIIRTTGARVETSFWTTLNDLLLQIPNILAFLAALATSLLVGYALGKQLARRLHRSGKTDLGRLLGAALTWLITLIGGLFALMLVFPRIDPSSILSLLGIGSIAIGFAFKDIFQNLVAGVILLIREPYRKGDEVCIGEIEGVVEEVETRATHIRTIDQRMVIIPNVRVFTEPITVNTDCAYRMTNYTLGVAYGGDIRRAMEIVIRAVGSAEGVFSQPPPQIAVQDLNDYSVDLLVLWAARAPYVEQVRTKSAVLLAIYDACRENDIALPFPTQVNLLRPLDEGREAPDRLNTPEPEAKA